MKSQRPISTESGAIVRQNVSDFAWGFEPATPRAWSGHFTTVLPMLDIVVICSVLYGHITMVVLVYSSEPNDYVQGLSARAEHCLRVSNKTVRRILMPYNKLLNPHVGYGAKAE